MANTKTKPVSDEDRARRRAEDREYARQAVEALCSSEGWQRWLTTRASFHGYSFANQVLIASQRPDAIRVAGFKKWLSLGYCVRKGETSIKIWAPCPPSKKALEAWRKAGADPDEKPRTFFRLTSVFADDQVAELPPPAEPAPLRCPIVPVPLDGDELSPTLPALIALAASISSTVTFETIPGTALGFYEVATRRIVIEQDGAVNQQAATLVHELAHALVRADHQDGDPTLNYAAEELVAESVAFTVIRGLGLENDQKAIPYLAHFLGDGDTAILERLASLIDRLARRIEDAMVNNDQIDIPNVSQKVSR